MDEPEVTFNRPSFLQTKIGKITLAAIALALIATITTSIIIFRPFNLFPKKTQIQNLTSTPSGQPVSLSASEELEVYKLSQSLVNTVLQLPFRKKLSLQQTEVTIGKETLPYPTIVDSWEIGSTSAVLSVQYDFQKKNPLNIDLSVTIPHTTNSISSKTVFSFLSRYLLIPPKLKFTCEGPFQGGNILCSGMITQADESKLGISLRSNTIKINEDIITICQIFAGSDSYSWTTCLHE